MPRLQLAGLLLLAVAAPGCQDKPAPAVPVDPEANIRANLAELGPADQALAERQRFCPLMPRVRLGARGVPTSVVVKGETVLVCCDGCVRLTKDEPDKAAELVQKFQAARASRPESATK